MNEEKQIKEMEKVIADEQMKIANDTNEYKKLMSKGVGYCYSEALYNASYRKESEVEKWTAFEIFEEIESIIEHYERLKRLGFQHDDKWRFDNLVSDIRDFMKEYEGE